MGFAWPPGSGVPTQRLDVYHNCQQVTTDHIESVLVRPNHDAGFDLVLPYHHPRGRFAAAPPFDAIAHQNGHVLGELRPDRFELAMVAGGPLPCGEGPARAEAHTRSARQRPG